jgi:hypothetical protein
MSYHSCRILTIRQNSLTSDFLESCEVVDTLGDENDFCLSCQKFAGVCLHLRQFSIRLPRIRGVRTLLTRKSVFRLFSKLCAKRRKGYTPNESTPSRCWNTQKKIRKSGTPQKAAFSKKAQKKIKIYSFIDKRLKFPAGNI